MNPWIDNLVSVYAETSLADLMAWLKWTGLSPSQIQSILEKNQLQDKKSDYKIKAGTDINIPQDSYEVLAGHSPGAPNFSGALAPAAAPAGTATVNAVDAARDVGTALRA